MGHHSGWAQDPSQIWVYGEVRLPIAKWECQNLGFHVGGGAQGLTHVKESDKELGWSTHMELELSTHMQVLELSTHMVLGWTPLHNSEWRKQIPEVAAPRQRHRELEW
jgi:hypothetical protein